MLIQYEPPSFPQLDKPSIFLAGSIEEGKAVRWQEWFINRLETALIKTGKDFIVLNPRRKEWDSTWEQSITNPVFFQQVTWELDFLQKADHKVFYFAENTLSPISLLEFGAFHAHDRIYPMWDDAYKRKGNLEIFCHRKGIERFKTFDDIIYKILQK